MTCRLRFFLSGLAGVLILLGPAAAPAQDADVVNFARMVLADLQDRSFADNREYCGRIGVAEDGTLVASRPRRGRRDGCRPTQLPRGARPLASYHTHAAFDPAADSELPSPQDLDSDMSEGVDGFVATPGGRLWFNDSVLGETRLICGPYCLPTDPAFADGIWGFPEPRYSLDQLAARLMPGANVPRRLVANR